jgi:uncharacterized protein YukE
MHGRAAAGDLRARGAARQHACALTPTGDPGRARTVRVAIVALLSVLAFGLLASVAAAEESAPVLKTAPTISGTPKDGNTLKVSTGKWVSATVPTFTYQWKRCDSAGENCTDIPGATSAGYRAGHEDVGKRLRARVTATNPAGGTIALSAPTAAVAAAGPKIVVHPKITGTWKDGTLLSASSGTWNGTPPLAFVYKWTSCFKHACSTVAGVSGPTYRLQTADIGHTFKVTVTASNASGSAGASSRVTPKILPGPPVSIAAPAVSGTPLDGQTLTAEPGTWGGTPTIGYSYRWRSCTLLTDECSDIAGADEPTYKVQPLDVANQIEVVVTATNSYGSTEATSPETSAVSALLPKNTSLPTITGILQDGHELLAGLGTWSGTLPITYSYQWELCNAAGEACHAIAEALGPNLAIIAADVGGTIRVTVTAANSAGSVSASSPATSLIGALLPANSTLPSITGSLIDGQLLTALTGSWTGTAPISYSYQWQICEPNEENCQDIQEAITSTLTLSPGEVGRDVRVLVKATNSAGSTVAASHATSLIGALLPGNTGLPSITGLLQDGQLLSAVTGSWSGTPPISYAYQWQQCNSAGEACKDISEATGSTLGLVSGLVGSTVRVIVKASNSGGSTEATSAATGLIGAILPKNTALPSITGLLQDGQLLSAATGSWSGSTPLSYAYQWQKCNAKGEECANLSGATGSTLGLLSTLVGSTVRVIVKASNSGGSTEATSAATGLIAALLPGNTSLPSIAGSLIDGQTLTAANGSWSGSIPLSYAYQWQQCNAKGESCENISGATGGTLGLVSTLVGSTVRVVVKATNSGGSTEAASPATGLIAALLPGNTSLPSIAGSLVDGQTLTASNGSWSGTAPISYAYQWQKCNAKGEECANLSGATASTLGLVSTLVGSTVRVIVKASNSGGSTEATSAATGLIAALLPKNTSLPSIGGLAEDKQTLKAATGSWSGTTPIAYSYQWQKCNAKGEACENLAGKEEALAVTEGLVTSTLRVVVKATNSGGSTEAASAATSPVLAALPVNEVQPVITGILKTGKELLAKHELWGGTQSGIKYAYQWQLCGALGLVGECKDIPGATGEHFLLELLDVGLTLRVGVTAMNERGTSPRAYSKVTGLIEGLGLAPIKGAAGTQVTVKGSGVNAATIVNFGEHEAFAEPKSSTEVVAEAPAGTSGTVPVTVSTPEGTTHETPTTQFTYTP